MARIAEIEARLLRWAEWLKCGDGSGYPMKSTLHEDWSPPSLGIRPTMRVSLATDAPATHRAVLRLGERTRATLAAHYLLRMPRAQAASILGCAERTVDERIERAHVEMATMLGFGGFCNMQETV